MHISCQLPSRVRPHRIEHVRSRLRVLSIQTFESKAEQAIQRPALLGVGSMDRVKVARTQCTLHQGAALPRRHPDKANRMQHHGRAGSKTCLFTTNLLYRAIAKRCQSCEAKHTDYFERLVSWRRRRRRRRLGRCGHFRVVRSSSARCLFEPGGGPARCLCFSFASPRVSAACVLLSSWSAVNGVAALDERSRALLLGWMMR